MDIEQLKLILEMVSHTTDGAKDFGTLWLGLHYATAILKEIGTWFCVAIAAFGVYKICVLLNRDDDEERLRHVRNRLGVGSPGPVTYSEYQQMLDKIDELKARKQ